MTLWRGLEAVLGALGTGLGLAGLFALYQRLRGGRGR